MGELARRGCEKRTGKARGGIVSGSRRGSPPTSCGELRACMAVPCLGVDCTTSTITGLLALLLSRHCRLTLPFSPPFHLSLSPSLPSTPSLSTRQQIEIYEGHPNSPGPLIARVTGSEVETGAGEGKGEERGAEGRRRTHSVLYSALRAGKEAVVVAQRWVAHHPSAAVPLLCCRAQRAKAVHHRWGRSGDEVQGGVMLGVAWHLLDQPLMLLSCDGNVVYCFGMRRDSPLGAPLHIFVSSCHMFSHHAPLASLSHRSMRHMPHPLSPFSRLLHRSGPWHIPSLPSSSPP